MSAGSLMQWLLQLWIFLAVTTFISPTTFACDIENHITITYDGRADSAVGYDAVSVLAPGEKKSGATRDRVPFCKCAKFLAAESGAMRNVAQFQGMEVRAVRDLSHVEQGTLEAMQQHGFAATTRSGDSIVLHHLGQNPAGPLVEMPAANHSIWNSVQHPLGNTAGAGLSATERATYNAWRTEYWQWRATQELNARRVLGQ